MQGEISQFLDGERDEHGQRRPAASFGVALKISRGGPALPHDAASCETHSHAYSATCDYLGALGCDLTLRRGRSGENATFSGAHRGDFPTASGKTEFFPSHVSSSLTQLSSASRRWHLSLTPCHKTMAIVFTTGGANVSNSNR
ncbi:hypothetical protein GEV33_014767 [Tenebrio molitor]|uniref:Uncharacterized protein n=1 Tax=Tenebrio molitor TaxID=7067 RepID=A0A8J6H665_TENMO|nr:hypothetical protein GEV33_014772 [Tenebrio molitor]KAH0808022.1 hypothetical protein GEV33_014767 [Tenebrio molitor]